MYKKSSFLHLLLDIPVTNFGKKITPTAKLTKDTEGAMS